MSMSRRLFYLLTFITLMKQEVGLIAVIAAFKAAASQPSVVFNLSGALFHGTTVP